MTRDAISNLVAGGERATVELKPFSARDVDREVRAFANAVWQRLQVRGAYNDISR